MINHFYLSLALIARAPSFYFCEHRGNGPSNWSYWNKFSNIRYKPNLKPFAGELVYVYPNFLFDRNFCGTHHKYAKIKFKSYILHCCELFSLCVKQTIFFEGFSASIFLSRSNLLILTAPISPR